MKEVNNNKLEINEYKSKIQFLENALNKKYKEYQVLEKKYKQNSLNNDCKIKEENQRKNKEMEGRIEELIQENYKLVFKVTN